MPDLEKKSQPSESEVREFWKWCGFFEGTDDYGSWPHGTVTVHTWRHPNGYVSAFLPPIDLNNLFKYAVPKLPDSFYELTLGTVGQTGEWICTLYFIPGNPVTNKPKNYDPAIALFWAIYEVIHKYFLIWEVRHD